jgi:AraC-like DNA-binding protein
MPWSAVQRFFDPEACSAAVQGSEVEVIPTTKGRFDTEITKVRFERLWAQRFQWTLPQVITVAHKSGRTSISFLTASKSPGVTHCGIEVLPGDVVINRREATYKRYDSAIQNGAMSLPTYALNAAVRAVTGREPPEKEQTRVVRPNSALTSRLLKLHSAVVQLAHDTPEILELPEVGRALEEQLIHVMVRCLAESAVLPITTGRYRYAEIMSSFDGFLKANPDQPLYLTEICAGIGVAERTLRSACEEHLGMGPIRYLTLRRMHLVRRALQQADPSKSTVTRTVTDYGFWELGRFSGAYRSLFGELPSETLRRSAD